MTTQYSEALLQKLETNAEARAEVVKLLLDTIEYFSDHETAPTGDWCKRVFLLDGSHMILTEYGWEPGSGKKSESNPDGYEPEDIRDEVNAPAAP